MDGPARLNSTVKSDNCASYALDSSVRFGAMRDALNRTGHPIVLSIEPFSINPDPAQSFLVANLWRTGCDISGDWNDILNRADIADKWAPLAAPGGWNDPDSAYSLHHIDIDIQYRTLSALHLGLSLCSFNFSIAMMSTLTYMLTTSCMHVLMLGCSSD
jgi:hypothetical protein